MLIMVSNDVKTVSSSTARSQSVISDINEKVICQMKELSEKSVIYSEPLQTDLLNAGDPSNEATAVTELKSEIVSSSGHKQSEQNGPEINITKGLENNAQIQQMENDNKESDSTFQQNVASVNRTHGDEPENDITTKSNEKIDTLNEDQATPILKYQGKAKHCYANENNENNANSETPHVNDVGILANKIQLCTDESPINEPIKIIEHKAQVLPEPIYDYSHIIPNKNIESSPNKSDDIFGDKEQPQNNEISVEGSPMKIRNTIPQELLVNIEHVQQELVITNKLPEVLIVAEKLPEHLPVAKNILSVSSSRTSSKEQIIHQEELLGQNEEEDTVDDGGSTLTIGGRRSTYSKQSDVDDIIEVVDKEETKQGSKRIDSAKYKDEDVNESCISPFFHIIYICLGILIISLIGLNFWFGFHLLFLIALLSVIGLLILVLTEFSEFHAE